MKLNQLPNFRVEDFPSEISWIGRLFTQLNPFIQAINQVLDNIDFTTNIRAVTRSYTITQFQTFSFQWPFIDASPQTLEIVKASKGSQQTPTILLAAWSFNAAQRTIEVSRITEVNASSVSPLSGTYQFTVRATV